MSEHYSLVTERDAAWLARLRDTFPQDALGRLTRAEYDYYSTHGEYLPGLARLALYYREIAENAVSLAGTLISYSHLREKVRLREDESEYAEAERLLGLYDGLVSDDA